MTNKDVRYDEKEKSFKNLAYQSIEMSAVKLAK